MNRNDIRRMRLWSPAPTNWNQRGRRSRYMAARSGRLEKRVRLAIPIKITSPQNPAATERTTTENVCSLGIRILTHRAKNSNEQIMISSLAGDLRTFARVVYYQKLPDGRFGIGLQFQGIAVDWPRNSMAGATD